MSSVDNRVVNMIFDNYKFEQGIQTSIKSLDNLKKGLELNGATKGLTDLDKVSKGVTLEHLISSVDSIASKFTTMGIIGVTALQNITNSAIEAGKNLIKSLSIDQLTEGFTKYENKTKSVQTIMNATGKSIEEVEVQMEKLNWFTDETSYNFVDMVDNVGKFTSAGVELDTAVTAMMGIANWAAISGGGINEAQRAMYNLSQAMGVGSVKLMDWKSIENANMATKEFKEVVIATAKELGTLDKNSKVTYANFNEDLSDGWFSKDVLLVALDQYGKYTEEVYRVATEKGITAAQAMELVSIETMNLGARAFKAAQEAKTFGEAIDATKDAVSTGWMTSSEIIFGNYEEAKILWTDLANTLYDVFAASAEVRNDMLKTWKEMGGRTDLIDSVKNIFAGLLSIAEPIKEAFRDIFPAMTAERLFEITARIKEVTSNFKLSETTSENLKRTFAGLFAVLDIGKEAFKAIFKALTSVLGYMLPVGDGVLSLTGSFGDFLVSVRDVVKETDIFNKVFGTIGKIVKPIGEVVKNAFDTIVGAIKSIAPSKTVELDGFGERVERSFKPITFIANAFKGAFDIIVLTIKKVAPIFAGLGTAIGKGLGTAQKSIMDWLNNVNFSGGLDIFNAGLFATILLGIRKFMKSLTSITDNAGGILDGFKSIFGGITGTFEALQSRLKADTLIKIAGAIAILTASVVVLSMINSDKLTIALTAITLLFTDLFASMAIFQKIMAGTAFKGMGKMVAAMIGLSTAVLILSAAMSKLASLDWPGLLKGLIGTAGLMGMLIASVRLMPNTGKVMKGATGLILFAVAINVLTSAVKKLGGLDTATLTKGLIGVGVLLAELSLFMNMTDLDGKGLLKGLGIMALATALVILSSAVTKLGELDTNALVKGLVGVGVILAEIGLFMNLTGDVTKVMSTAIGLTILGTAMLIFARAIENMGQMTWEEIAKGLITMGGALTIITVALQFLHGALGGAAALLVVAGALAILTPVLKSLGNMTWQEIATGLITLAGTFVVIGAAAVLLAPVTPAILALAGAIALLGVAVALIGGGILALSVGLAALGVAGAAGVGTLVLAVTGLIGLIPMFLQQIANGIIAFANIIGDGGPAILKALSTILIALSEAIIEAIPVVVKAIVLLLETLLAALIDFIPKLVDGGLQLIIGILKGIDDNIAKVIEMAVKVVLSFVKGVADMIPVVIQAAFDLIINFINGLAEALRGNTQPLLDAIHNLATSIIEGAVKVFSGGISLFLDAGKDLIGGLIDGIKSGVKKVGDAAKDVGKAALDGIKGFLKIQSPSKVFKDEVGKNIGNGLVDGIRESIPRVLGESYKMGDATMSGTADGIKKNKGKTKKAASEAAKGVYEVTKEWVDKQRKYHELSLDQEYSKWESIQSKYKEGSKERLDIELRMREIQQQKIREQYDFSKKWIDEEKFYKRLKLEEELAAWERVHARYKDGTKEEVEYAKQAAREIFRIKSDILREEFNNSKKWIDEEKFYKRLSLTEELAAWERVHARYKDGSKEEVEYAKEAARNIYTIKQQLNDKLISAEENYHQKVRDLNERTKNDIQALWDKYDSAIESRYQSLMSTFGLFDKVEISENPVSGSELLSNLEGQVNAFEDWKDQINLLVEKGVSQSMIDELKKMGPKSLEQIRALNQLTAPELDKYSNLFAEKSRLARDMAYEEMEEMRRDTQYQVRELRRQTREQLAQYKADWVYEVSQITGKVYKGFDDMRLFTGIQMDAFKMQSVTKMEETTEGMKTAVKDQDWIGVGSNIVKGIQQGVDSQADKLIGQMVSLALSAIRAVNKILGIRSPSREFAKIGGHVVDGFIQGVQNGSNSLYNTMEDMADNTLNTMNGVIGRIYDVINSEMDMTPVIRPVLDLDDVRINSKEIHGLLQPKLSLDRVADVSTKIGNKTNTNDQMETSSPNHVSFVQNNYSPKALSRIDIYRQTRNQISAMKGVLNSV